MKFVLSICLFALLMSSCTFYEPEYRGGETIRFGQLNGRDLKFNAGAKVYNENGFAIKIKPSTLDLYIEGEYMGKVHLDEKVRMKRKQETFIDAPFTATLEKGAMFKAMKFANKKELQIRLSGKVKTSVWCFGKKIHVNETRTIDGSNLKFL